MIQQSIEHNVKGVYMKKDSIKDFLSATGEEIVDTTLNSDLVPGLVTEILKSCISEGVSGIIGEIAGAVVPGVNGVMLSYKQKRFERNIAVALDAIKNRLSSLEDNFEALNSELKQKFSTTYCEWLLDNLQEEKQAEKVNYHVNGYINLMNNEANDNLMLIFFNTMNELSNLDIDVLKCHCFDMDITTNNVCDKYNLDFYQVRLIREKLARLGLLQSKNEEYNDNNLEYVVQHLMKVEQDRKKSKPSGVNFEKSRIKKLSRNDTYYITSIGNSYLKIIGDQENNA